MQTYFYYLPTPTVPTQDSSDLTPIKGQGQGYGRPNIPKKIDFKVYLLCWLACNLKTDGDL